MFMKFYIIITLLFSAIFLNSCKEDIELVGEFKETAIVYGVLDQADSIHYIKINRAFIGPGNALEFAKIPDSSYFENITATITEKIDGQDSRVWTLIDTLIDNKDENGIFYAPTQKLYYFKHNLSDDEKLKPNAIYFLNIVINEGTPKEFNITGETALVDGIISGQSNPNSSFQFIDNQKQLKAFGVSVSDVGNSKLVNISLKLNFEEYKTNGDTNKVSVDWNVSESEVSGSYSAIIQGQRFYELISENVSQDENITKRKFKSIQIIITGGSDELNTYISSNEPSSSLTQSKPNFTNLTSTNNNSVIGIFTSRQTLTVNKLYFSSNAPTASCLDSKSREYLCNGPITSTLLFCSDHNSDASKTYFCQ